MSQDTIVQFRDPSGFSTDLPAARLRNGPRDLIARAVEAEPAAFMDARDPLRDEDGRRRIVSARGLCRNARSGPASALFG